MKIVSRVKKHILKSIIGGDFYLTVHARKRMDERLISEHDITVAAKSSVRFEHQERNNTYLIEGHTDWGHELSIVAAVRSDVLIVTVFFKGEYDEEDNN